MINWRKVSHKHLERFPTTYTTSIFRWELFLAHTQYCSYYLFYCILHICLTLKKINWGVTNDIHKPKIINTAYIAMIHSPAVTGHKHSAINTVFTQPSITTDSNLFSCQNKEMNRKSGQNLWCKILIQIANNRLIHISLTYSTIIMYTNYIRLRCKFIICIMYNCIYIFNWSLCYCPIYKGL